MAQPDGTLVTEKKKTTEHEELFDEDLPEKDDNSTGSRERVDQKVIRIRTMQVPFQILLKAKTTIMRLRGKLKCKDSSNQPILVTV